MRWLMFLSIDILANIFGWLINPIVPMFANENGTLPKWLEFAGTSDNSLDGDEGWKAEHRPFLIEDSKLKQWANRTAWLYRNCMYGFKFAVLGFVVKPDFAYSCEGSESVSNRPLHNGLVRRKLVSGGKEYWQWYYVRAWSDTKCIRINLGWKLWGTLKTGKQCAYVFSINPFMGYSKV